MKKVLACILVMALLASCVLLAVIPAAASPAGISEEYKELFEGDNKLTRDELVDAILSHMLEEEGALQIDELRDAAHVYVYWEGEPRSITDSVGREVTIYKPVKRVVCTLSHHLEALRILKVSKDTIVGVPLDEDPVFFPEFGDVTAITGGWDADVEAILKLHPEVVLLPARPGPRGVNADYEQEQLEAAGVTVLRFTFNQPETFDDELEKCGYVFEKEEEADDFIAWQDDILNSIEAKLSGVDPKRVYAEHQPYTISTSDDDIIAAAGGEDIFAGIPEAADVETLIREEPDIVIRAVYGGETGYGLTPSPGVIGRLEGVRNEIFDRGKRDGWINATEESENASIYIISSELWTYLPASGCRPFVGQCYLAKWFHPDLFPELNPKDIHQTYLREFQGLDIIDLDEQGVFVYHPEKHPDGN